MHTLACHPQGYVRAEKIQDMVEHISISRHVHLGSPSGVESGLSYCSIDGGVILFQVSEFIHSSKDNSQKAPHSEAYVPKVI